MTGLLVSSNHSMFVNQSFLVDTDNLNDADDIKADDLGSWRNDGQHSRWVKVKQVGGHVHTVEFCSGKPKSDPNTYCLRRHYYIHHSNHQFKIRISHLSGEIYVQWCSMLVMTLSVS